MLETMLAWSPSQKLVLHLAERQAVAPGAVYSHARQSLDPETQNQT